VRIVIPGRMALEVGEERLLVLWRQDERSLRELKSSLTSCIASILLLVLGSWVSACAEYGIEKFKKPVSTEFQPKNDRTTA
jgi:hypothetical protein